MYVNPYSTNDFMNLNIIKYKKNKYIKYIIFFLNEETEQVPAFV